MAKQSSPSDSDQHDPKMSSATFFGRKILFASRFAISCSLLRILLKKACIKKSLFHINN